MLSRNLIIFEFASKSVPSFALNIRTCVHSNSLHRDRQFADTPRRFVNGKHPHWRNPNRVNRTWSRQGHRDDFEVGIRSGRLAPPPSRSSQRRQGRSDRSKIPVEGIPAFFPLLFHPPSVPVHRFIQLSSRNVLLLAHSLNF